MAKMISACGLDCADCEAYKATQAGDKSASEKVADAWTKQFGEGKITFKAEDTFCDGCLTESERQGVYCGQCDIRACVTGKDIANCAHCPDYACENLNKFFEFAPSAKTSLEEIRAQK